jgi:hypothetical protein
MFQWDGYCKTQAAVDHLLDLDAKTVHHFDKLASTLQVGLWLSLAHSPRSCRRDSIHALEQLPPIHSDASLFFSSFFLDECRRVRIQRVRL